MAIEVPAIAGKVTHIGRAGENLATTVTFDVADWLQEFGRDGTFSLFVQQGGGEYYVQDLVQGDARQLESDEVKWNVVLANTTVIGMGKCELQYSITVENNGEQIKTVVKSVIYDIVVTNSLDVEALQTGTPKPVESWLNRVTRLSDDIEHAKDFADEARQWANGHKRSTEDSSQIIEVGSQDEAYQNNSKYWSEVSAKWADYNNNPNGNNPSTSSPTATNNAKYWSDQARKWSDNNNSSSTPGADNNARAYAIKAGQWADYENVATDSPTETNNARYWADMAHTWATGEDEDAPGENNSAKYWAEQARMHDEALVPYFNVIDAQPEVTTNTLDPFYVDENQIVQESQASVTVNFSTQEGQEGFSFVFDIPKGKGSGLALSGTVSQKSGLDSVVNPVSGTAYGVNSNPPFIWVYSGQSSSVNTEENYHGWINYGLLSGSTAKLYKYESISS